MNQPPNPELEEEPENPREAYYGKTRSATRNRLQQDKDALIKNKQAVNKFIERNYKKPAEQPANDPLPEPDKYDRLKAITETLKNLPITDETTQKRLRGLLFNSVKESKNRGAEILEFMGKAHFPVKFDQSETSKARWMVRWRKEFVNEVRLAYRIFPGALNPAHRLFSPKLRTVLQLLGRCLICRCTNQEVPHPRGIVTTGSHGGECSAKIADTIVPQTLTNVIHMAETFSIETPTIKVMKTDSRATIPRKGSAGSAAYDLFPLKPITLYPNQRVAVVTGLAPEMPDRFYGQIMPRSGLSMDRINMVPGVIDSDYRGIISVIVSNDSINTYTLMPDKAMAQIIFEPVVNATLKETHTLKETQRGARGFGSTDAHTFNASVKTLEKYQERPPRTHYLGSKV